MVQYLVLFLSYKGEIEMLLAMKKKKKGGKSVYHTLLNEEPQRCSSGRCAHANVEIVLERYD